MVKSNTRNFYLVILAISFLYAIQFYVNNKINPVLDQTAFQNYAVEFNNNYFYFAYDRFFTWSSRLLIESATLLFSTHEKLFVLGASGATFLMLLAGKKYSPALPYLPALLIFIFLPATEFLSAGSIPTYTNYIFPASFLIFSLFTKYTTNKYLYIFSVCCFTFSIMQEQLAVYAFLWLGFDLFKGWVKKDNSHFKTNSLYFFVSMLGIISAKIAPGNAVRFGKEVVSWFPNFQNLTIFQKIGLGILETGDGMISNSFSFVLLFLVTLFVVSIIKRDVLSISLTSFILMTVSSQKLGWSNLLQTLTSVSKLAREAGTFSFNLVYLTGVLFYLILFLIITFVLWRLCHQDTKIWAIYLLIIGLASRMLVSLSPTIYASGTRTYLPVMISLMLITCMLVNDMYRKFRIV